MYNDSIPKLVTGNIASSGHWYTVYSCAIENVSVGVFI